MGAQAPLLLEKVMSLQLKTEAVRTVDGTTLTGTLADLGDPTSSPARIIAMFNGCDAEVVISWDNGATEGFILPATSAIALDAATNKDENEVTPFLAAGSQFQAKHNGAIPTTGNLSITVIT